jgi:hypothetical protein
MTQMMVKEAARKCASGKQIGRSWLVDARRMLVLWRSGWSITWFEVRPDNSERVEHWAKGNV